MQGIGKMKISNPPLGAVDIEGSLDDTEIQITYSLGEVLNFKMGNVPVSKLPMPYGSTNLKIGWLPPMVRWISESGSVVVLERPPERRQINYVRKKRSSASKMTAAQKAARNAKFNILVPWQVFVIGLAENYTPINIFSFTRPASLKTVRDQLFCMPMPNVYGDGKVCTPMLAEMADTECHSISQAVNLAYGMFWSSGFNYDLINSVKIGMSGGMVKDAGQSDADTDEFDRFFRSWSKNVSDISDMTFVNPGDSERSQAPMGQTPDDLGGTKTAKVTLMNAIKKTAEMIDNETGSALGMLTNGLTNAGTSFGTQL